MRLFTTQEEEEKFIIELLESDFWTYIRNMLDLRRSEIMRLLSLPNITPDGRAMLTGRLLEVEYLHKTPTQMMEIAKAQQKFETQGDRSDLETYVAETIPEVHVN